MCFLVGGSPYVDLAGLELTLQSSLASNSACWGYSIHHSPNSLLSAFFFTGPYVYICMSSMSELGTPGGIFQHTAQGVSGPWHQVGARARCGGEGCPGQMWGISSTLVRCGGRELPSKRLLAEASNSLFLVDLERLGKV